MAIGLLATVLGYDTVSMACECGMSSLEGWESASCCP